jgi:hypothetical protein
MNQSYFKPYDEKISYGMFGYAGKCCDDAIRHDNPAMAEECWQRG